MNSGITLDYRKLPLHPKHLERGARIGAFGEWEVPLYYTSIIEEHQSVRNSCGIFDISHMGEFWVEGPNAVTYLDQLLPRNISAQKFSKALYMPLLNEKGGFVDDIIVYRIAADRFYIIVNAGNVDKDFSWFQSHLISGVTLQNRSSEKGLIAVQGPKSAEILDQIYPDLKPSSLPYYGFAELSTGIVARTGYTGEDGFEVMLNTADVPSFWDRLLTFPGVLPAGFGARDTLRLEACMPLYGHDMNDSITPVEAGLDWACDFTKKDFVGKAPLDLQKKEGVSRRLVAFEMMDRGIPRQDHVIQKNASPVGIVTSGSFSPTLQKNIGMGYVQTSLSAPGEEIEILVRDKTLKAKIVKKPFYKRSK